MPSVLPPLYFSAADGGMEHSINQEQFDKSLLYNLLFEDQGLLIPDVFFFNCVYLRKFADEPGSLFLRALREGLVIPAFRNGESGSFQEALAEIGGTRVLGIEETWDADKFARKLDGQFLHPRARSKLRVWPADLGGSFTTLVEDVLRQSDPQLRDEYQAQLWRGSERWRTECLEDARRLTATKAGSGIRRAEIWNAVGIAEHVRRAGEKFDRPYELVNAITEEVGNREAQAVKFFIELVNAVYQRSQASRFKVQLNVPQPLTKNLNLAIPGELGKSSTASPSVVEHQTIVRVPAPEALSAARSSELLAVHDSDEGREYFGARIDWVANPHDLQLRDALDSKAQEYADKLLQVANASKRSSPAAVLGVKILREGTLPALGGVGVDLTIEAMHLPSIYKLVGVGIATALYSFNLMPLPGGIDLEDYVVRTEASVQDDEPEMNVTP